MITTDTQESCINVAVLGEIHPGRLQGARMSS